MLIDRFFRIEKGHNVAVIDGKRTTIKSDSTIVPAEGERPK